MTVELTDNEKYSIIQQHLRNVNYNKYNLEISLIEENAATPKSQQNIDSLTVQLNNINAKISALQAEMDNLNPTDTNI